MKIERKEPFKNPNRVNRVHLRLRVPPSIRKELEERAIENGTSLTAEAVEILKREFEQAQKQTASA